MLKINSSDKVSIKRLPNTDGFDGHSLRAYYYWKEQMPEINHKISRLNESGKFYKVTINGETEYYHESDMPENIKRNLGISTP